MAKKETEFENMRDLLEERKKIDKRLHKAMIPCSHTKENGKLKVEFINGTRCRCKRCGAEFDFTRISNEELRAAVRTIHNALNQIKALSSDPSKEYGVIKQLGTLDFNLKDIAELYQRTQNESGKGGKMKKKKNRGYGNDFGSFGADSIDFIGGGKKYYRY